MSRSASQLNSNQQENLRPMKRFRILIAASILILPLVLGCSPKVLQTKSPSTFSSDKPAERPAETTGRDMSTEPQYITVQHCLIGFQGSVPGKGITRSKEQAQKLAEEIFKRAKSGADFAAIVKEYTDDSPPGIYKMANRRVPVSRGVYSRDGMVPAFGDTGFPLEVGAYGLASFDPVKSPFGWHIVKRIE
jgi:hypothetical protein